MKTFAAYNSLLLHRMIETYIISRKDHNYEEQAFSTWYGYGKLLGRRPYVVLMLPEGLPPAIVATILELFLVWRYRDAFKGIVQP
jgi:hypothetical protein